MLPVVKKKAPILKGVDFETAPDLLGYVVTKAKQKSEFVKQGLSNSSANVAVLKGLNLDTYLSDVASRGPMEEMREPSTA